MLSLGRSPRRTPCRTRARLSLPYKHSIVSLLASTPRSLRSRARRTTASIPGPGDTATSTSKHKGVCYSFQY